MQTVLCPHCNAKIKHISSHAGQIISCPRCRGQLQLPHPPQVASGNSPFEGIDENSCYRPRRQRQPSYAGLWTLAVISLLGIAFTGLWWSGVVQFELPRQEAVKEAKNVRSINATPKSQQEKERPRPPQGKQESTQSGEQEKQERELAEAVRKKAAEQAMRQGEID